MREINVLTYLENAAKSHPDRVAFKDSAHFIKYSDLKLISEGIGRAILKRAGMEKALMPLNRPVMVYIDRNVESLISFMSVVQSGNFYVPVDITLPKERIQSIKDTLNPVLEIHAGNPKKKPESAVLFSELLDEAGGELLEDGGYKAISSFEDGSCLSSIRKNSIDTDPLYCIFTSGTTGVPKGVLINHRSVIDLVHSFDSAFDFPEYPVFGNQAPFDFDVSSKDIYNALMHSGTVVIIPKGHFVMPASLLPYLKDNNVNVLIWAVSALRIVENFKLFDACVPDKIKWIMFSGEVMPVRTLNYIKGYLPDATYVNLYGPTEITCNCNYYIIGREFKEEETIPIGGSFENTRVFLVDTENGDIINEAGQSGEICVEGTCLFAGYYNAHPETDKARKQKPGISSHRVDMYCTGDLGRYDENGDLYYVSRKDYQIKHMGHRIELGEIETVVNALPGVHNGCCAFNEEKELIVLFYEAEEEADKEIRGAIKEKLPAFMMPNKIVRLEKMPMNSHDKVDRRKLLELSKEC